MIHSLPIPWRDLTGSGLAPWTLTVRSPFTGEVTISASEALDLCAAIELERVHPVDARDLLTHRRQTGEVLVWCRGLRGDRGPDLMAGARGLKREDAPGEMTVDECIRRIGFEIVGHTVIAMVPVAPVRPVLRRVK